MKPLKGPLVYKHERVNSRWNNPDHIPELYTNEIVELAVTIFSEIRERNIT